MQRRQARATRVRREGAVRDEVRYRIERELDPETLRSGVAEWRRAARRGGAERKGTSADPGVGTKARQLLACGSRRMRSAPLTGLERLDVERTAEGRSAACERWRGAPVGGSCRLRPGSADGTSLSSLRGESGSICARFGFNAAHSPWARPWVAVRAMVGRCLPFDAPIRAGRSSSARPAWAPGWRSSPAREPVGSGAHLRSCPRPRVGRNFPPASRAATCGMGARSFGAAPTGRRRCWLSGPPLLTSGGRGALWARECLRTATLPGALTCRISQPARRSFIGSSFAACSTPER